MRSTSDIPSFARSLQLSRMRYKNKYVENIGCAGISIFQARIYYKHRDEWYVAENIGSFGVFGTSA